MPHADPEVRSDYAKRWREQNRERVQAYNKAKSEAGYFREWNRARKAQDPEAWRRSQMAIRLKSKYGVTIEQYDAMLLAQDGRCAICRKAETMRIKGTLVMLAVDHDHDTGAVRGLLCVKCNMLIGGAGHDPDILRDAIEYLAP